MANSTTAAPSVQQPHAGKIDHTALLAVIWSLCGFCILLVLARLAIHLKFSRRLWIDDAFTVLALLILIANTIVTTLMAPPLYEILLLSAGLLIPDAGFMDRATFYLKCQFASTVLFWSCLWAVKGCFLAFFWRLTNQLTWPRRAWWVVAVITVLSYIGSVITYPVSCTSFVLGECETPDNIRLSLISLRYSTAVDMITDFLIILIPLWLTFGLKMSLGQKLGLVGVLCLGVITMVFSAIRIIVTNTNSVHPEISWLALWSCIESSIAVIVACLTSFRILFTQLKKGSSYPGGYGGRSNNIANRYANHSKSGQRDLEVSKHAKDTVREMGSEEDDSIEMDAVKRHKGVTMCIGGDDGRASSIGSDKDWHGDTGSVERILPSEAIRVQTTWRVNRD